MERGREREGDGGRGSERGSEGGGGRERERGSEREGGGGGREGEGGGSGRREGGRDSCSFNFNIINPMPFL